MATSETIRLSGERETLLVTLYAKALESRSPASILKDSVAEAIVQRLDYDFARLGLGARDATSLAIRAKFLDDLVRRFIAAHPDAIVLNLGCGLDSRIARIDPPAGIRWFDLDYPDVIDIRRRFYPARDGYAMIGSSVTEAGWLEAVPHDSRAIIIAEGLLPYLGTDDVPQLLNRVTAHFPGGELAFDGYSSLGLALLPLHPAIRATGATLHWAIDDPKELERQVPRLTFVAEIAGADFEDLAQAPWPMQMLARCFSAIPVLRRIGRMLRYRF